jgi:hypothetical protein
MKFWLISLLLWLVPASVASAAIMINVDPSSTTYLNLPTDKTYFFAIIPVGDDCTTSSTTLVVPPIVLPQVLVSTGPTIMKSQTTTDCYAVEYMNSNGTCGPRTWVPCPK